MTVSPARDTDGVGDDLSIVNDAVWVAGTVAVDRPEFTCAPEGAVPDAVAVLVTAPASRSAWVTV